MQPNTSPETQELSRAPQTDSAPPVTSPTQPIGTPSVLTPSVIVGDGLSPPIVPLVTTVNANESFNLSKENTTWSKIIPRINYITLAICAGFLAIVDVPILVSSPELAGFFYIMIGSTVCFGLILLIERYIGNKLRHKQVDTLDGIIVGMIVARNVIFILNVIPYIQLLGMAGSATIVPILTIIEIVLVMKRLKQHPENA